jgi:hypothetical protein
LACAANASFRIDAFSGSPQNQNYSSGAAYLLHLDDLAAISERPKSERLASQPEL